VKRLVVTAAVALTAAASCVPTLPHDPTPEAMEFDPQSFPPRVPQPTSLIVNPTTKKIDFSLAGLTIPSDCTMATIISQAECEFDQYLQTLDGFPTVTPAQTPATADLDPATLTPQNVVAFAARAGTPVADLQIGFQTVGRFLTLRPKHWSVGEFYWAAVRGYANGVRATSGAEVVGVPTQFLLKQETPLTCGAATPDELDPKCPAYALLLQKQPDKAAASVFQLEQIRSDLQNLHAWEAIQAAGIPKEEVAVIWGFPTHSTSVAEVDPSPAAMIVPQMTAPNQIKIAVQGPVDPATVRSFVLKDHFGGVIVVDLTTLATMDLVNGLPHVEAEYRDGNIVITAAAPLPIGHQFGVFLTTDIHDPSGRSLSPSPVSKLLTLRAPLVTSTGKSTLSSVGDADASMLEVGRSQLATLFDNALLDQVIGLSRDALVYCFAFPVVAQP
jgi:hypothetical protein